MNNQGKDTLRRLILRLIQNGSDIQEATAKLKRIGYNATTIRRYYRAMK